MKHQLMTLTFAEKTTNIYCLTREENEKILNDSITATYKKASNNIKKKLIAAGKQNLCHNKILKECKQVGKTTDSYH